MDKLLHALSLIAVLLADQARRDMPVDVQVGPFVWEDAPQELRSRLWIALLTNPDLIGNLVQEKVTLSPPKAPSATCCLPTSSCSSTL